MDSLHLRVLLMTIMTTQVHALQLQVLNNNPGVLPVREGTAVLSKDKWIIARVLDFKPIREDLDLNIQCFRELNSLVSVKFIKNFTYNFIDVREQVDYMQNLTVSKFEQITPTFKIKRGLINPIGSLIKIITGNLDHDDAIKYDKLISEIKSDQDANDKKITLISEMVQILSNSTITLNRNLIRLNREIATLWQNYTENLRIEHFEVQIISAYNKIYHNLQTIHVKLSEIETSFALSRLGILHQSIIDSNKLLSLLENIHKKDKLVYTPSLENLVKIEQTITLKAYFKKSQITYVLEIPLIEKESYIYYKLIPLPVYQNPTVIILPKYPYLLAKGLKIRLLAQPCQEIDEASFICINDEMLQFIQDPCITDLMMYVENVKSCIQIPVIIEDIKIQILQQNQWILYARDETLLTKTCPEEISRQKIQGTYILTLDDPCEIKIQNITLKMRQTNVENIEHTKSPMLNLPLLDSTSKIKTAEPVHLEDVDLTDLKILSFALKKSVSGCENSEKAIIHVKSVSVWTLCIYVILITFILCALVYKYRMKFCKISVRSSPETENSVLKEGGVTSGTSADACLQRQIFGELNC
ncbi:uncharacterized protein LOC134199478 [Bombyx mori]|uniref:uncharacterized protein LOC134199478 n=1 Tax=Bombyx mori TaxID=7091 RepID=UPI002ECFEA26